MSISPPESTTHSKFYTFANTNLTTADLLDQAKILNRRYLEKWSFDDLVGRIRVYHEIIWRCVHGTNTKPSVAPHEPCPKDMDFTLGENLEQRYISRSLLRVLVHCTSHRTDFYLQY